jgi:hypothetical protein
MHCLPSPSPAIHFGVILAVKASSAAVLILCDAQAKINPEQSQQNDRMDMVDFLGMDCLENQGRAGVNKGDANRGSSRLTLGIVTYDDEGSEAHQALSR